MNKQFHNFLVGVSVLPALLVVPAAADNKMLVNNETVNLGNGTEDVDVNSPVDVFNNGRLVVDAGSDGTINMSSTTDLLRVSTKFKVDGNWVGNETQHTYSTADFTAKDITFDADGVAIWVLNRTLTDSEVSTVNLTADSITINSRMPGIDENNWFYGSIIAMSQGVININGDTKITSGGNAILTRGNAVININANADKKTQMDGNVVFNYNKDTSNTGVDAVVNIGLNGSDSYWNGNTMVGWDDYKPTADKLEVNSATLTLKNGAVWNASKITDFDQDYGTSDNYGQYYTALNNLVIDNGIVNIADTTRGITVENASIADATFNGGVLNIGEMTLTGGTSIFNNNVAGVDDDSVLTVNSGATMNIGTNNVDVHKIVLNGNMLATLRSGDDAQITANNFSGNGTLKLTMKEAGTYQVFGDETFSTIAWDDSGLTTDSPIYNLVWNGGEVTATRKTIEEIADSNELSDAAAATVSNLTDSTSDALNDLAVKMQEKLAEAVDDESKAAVAKEVEKATKAIHPETESVTQSVASSVQNTVTNLASARMSAPTMGRNGGDLNLTSGGVWAQGLYNRTKQHDSFHGDTRGIAAGFDGTINRVWTVGAGYSYAYSDITGSERDTEIDSNTIFVYGQYKPAEWYVNAVLNYTMSDYSEKGTALGTPVTADYDVDSFGGVLTAGYDFASGITPELGLRYMHVSSDDYTNSLGVKTDSKDTDYLTGILGAKYAFNIAAGKYINLIPQLNAAVKYDMLSDGNSATVAMPGVNSYTIDGERLSRFGGEFGIGLGMKYRSLDLSVNYDIDVRKDYTSQTGMLKLRYNF